MKFSDIAAQFKQGSDPLEGMKKWWIALAVKQKLDVGHALNFNVFLYNTLNPKQKESLIPAIEALVSDGWFIKSGEHYQLTELGKNSIY